MKPAPTDQAYDASQAGPPGSRPRILPHVLISLWALGLCGSLVGWHFLEREIKASQDRDQTIHSWVSESRIHLANRRWEEAEETLRKIETFLPDSAIVTIGRRAVASGLQEEETQFLSYWTGQALAELEAGRLEEAENALKQVTKLRPDHQEADRLLKNIAAARLEQAIQSEIKTIQTLMDQLDWDQSFAKATELAAAHPENQNIAIILNQATKGREQHQADLARASELLAQARALDSGQFNQEALDMLREAALLSPGHQEITTLLERMSSYTRTIRVPADFPTPAAALMQCRENDRILISEGVWKGPLVIKRPVKIQGSGPESTIISCEANQGNALTIMAANVEIDGLACQHETLQGDPGDRFSAVVVAKGNCEFRNCRFLRSSGHGLAVIHGAQASARRCKFMGNAWNGAAASGRNSSLRVEDCESSGNFHNGIEIWQEATAALHRNTISANTRNGIHIDQRPSTVTCSDNTISKNREFGLCLSSTGPGSFQNNQISGNLLGGILIRCASREATVTTNESVDNQGPDLILEKELSPEPYRENQLGKSRQDALKTNAIIDP